MAQKQYANNEYLFFTQGCLAPTNRSSMISTQYSCPNSRPSFRLLLTLSLLSSFFIGLIPTSAQNTTTEAATPTVIYHETLLISQEEKDKLVGHLIALLSDKKQALNKVKTYQSRVLRLCEDIDAQSPLPLYSFHYLNGKADTPPKLPASLSALEQASQTEVLYSLWKESVSLHRQYGHLEDHLELSYRLMEIIAESLRAQKASDNPLFAYMHRLLEQAGRTLPQEKLNTDD